MSMPIDSIQKRLGGVARPVAGGLLAVLALVASFDTAPPLGAAAPDLRTALTFHAPFDGGVDAAFASGDPKLYFAKSREARAQAQTGLPPNDALQVVPGEGRHGDALRIRLRGSPLVFFKGADNIRYRARDWSGTVSLWLSLDPDRDLAKGYSDPLLISPRSWDDASLFIDFTRDDVPRRFRFAAFADKGAWNPDNRPWEKVALDERPMIELTGRHFERGRWTHVALTWERFNTGGTDGVLTGYLDGEPVGTLTGRRQVYTWTPEDVLIALGIDYIGLVDDLAIFDRALSRDEVRTLHRLPTGVGELHAAGNQ
jgi:hypothetical protein